MNNFEILNELPKYQDLLNQLTALNLEWKDNQICINTTRDDESRNNYHLGCGSLYYDWSTKRVLTDSHGNEKIVVDPYETPLKDTDFKVLCDVFNGTVYEDIYNSITDKYFVGRIRIIKSKPKTTMTWHVDDTIRLHYPIKTQEGCFMIIEQEVKHLTENTWWMTDTKKYHTAVNASKEDRIHLVATIIGKK